MQYFTVIFAQIEMGYEVYFELHSSIRTITRPHMKKQSNPLFLLHSLDILMESQLGPQNKLMNQNGWHAECQCVIPLLPQPIYIFHMRPKWRKEVIVCPPILHWFPQETILVKSQGNSNSSPQQHCTRTQPPSSALLGKLLLPPKKKCLTILNGNYHSILSCLEPVIMQRERDEKRKRFYVNGS